MNRAKTNRSIIFVLLGFISLLMVFTIAADKPIVLAQPLPPHTLNAPIDLNTSYAWVTRYDGEGGVEDVTSLPFGDKVGSLTDISSYIGHTVDTVSSSYVLNWRPNNLGIDFQLCGMQVAYRLLSPDDGVEDPTFYYVNVAGSTFRPRNKTSTFRTDLNTGCIYLTSGSVYDVYNIHLNIPSGSRIDYLRVYYFRKFDSVFLPVLFN